MRLSAPPLLLTVLGGVRLTGLDRLRVTLKAERVDGPHALPLRHNLDLYHAGQVAALTDRAAAHFECERADMKATLAALTDALERHRLTRVAALEAPAAAPRAVSTQEQKEARAYLEASDLLERTGRDIGRSGVVGEESNRLLMFLAFTSRLRPRPLQVVTLAASGTGKTYLQDAVARLIPDEDRVEVTALSENALYYFGREELRHRLLLIEDLDGVADVLYPLRELQSKGRLSKTVATKDARGRLRSETVTVEGPVCVAGCTTREGLYADNASRALLLHLDQSDEQNAAVLAYQRRESAGVVDAAEQEGIRRLFQNVQRVLAPVSVRNPYAERLALPPGVAGARRANPLYLGVIEAVTFYHQRQREAKTDPTTGEAYVEATLDDVEAANRLMAPVLTTKADEITPACRAFLDELQAWLAGGPDDEATFHAGDMRRALRLSPSRLKRYLSELRAYGYAEVAGGTRYRQGYEYRLTDAAHEGDPAGVVVRSLAETLDALRRDEAAG